jgi:hypothetical protein
MQQMLEVDAVEFLCCTSFEKCQWVEDQGYSTVEVCG